VKRILTVCAVLAVAACSPQTKPAEKTAAVAPAKPAVVNAAAPGLYTMDRAHTSVNFRVSHMGLSHFTARFTKMDGTLQFDPANPATMSVSATLDPASLQTNYPLKDVDFDKDLRGKEMFDVAAYPDMSFHSTKVEQTGPNAALVTGDLSLHGVTKPVVLETTFNGGMAPNAMDPAGARIGFSAHGTLKRSDFGMGYGVPPAGSNFGVSDEVEIIIETEFTKK
jgi:polyisoprenoid-binding protein YceI